MTVATIHRKHEYDFNNGSARLAGSVVAFNIDNVVARERGIAFEMTGTVSGVGSETAAGTFHAKGTIEGAFGGGKKLDLEMTVDITHYSTGAGF